MRRAHGRLLSCVFTLCGLACARGLESQPHAAAPSTPRETLRAFLESRRLPEVEPNPRLRPGDVIRIHAQDAGEVNGDYTIEPSGALTIPLCGRIRAAGRTPAELTERLAARLKSVVVDPKLDVSVVELSGRMVTVTGGVEKPEPVNLGARGKTLLEVLMQSGGLTPEAAGVVRVIPSAAPEPGLFAEPAAAADPSSKEAAVEIAAADLLRGGEGGALLVYLRPGDVVDVPKAGEASLRREKKPAPSPEPVAAARESAAAPPAQRPPLAQSEAAPAVVDSSPPAQAASTETGGAPPPRSPPPPAVRAAPNPGLLARLFGKGSSVSVVGLVERPGTYPLGRVKNVSEAVAKAGKRFGANLAAVEVDRRMPWGPVHLVVNVEEIDRGLRSDEPLRAGDTITVPGVNW